MKTRKLLIVACLLFINMGAYAQGFTIDSLTSEVEYEVVLTQQNTKDELYTRAKQWVSQNFGSSEAVIDLDDKQQGQLFLKGETSTTHKVLLEGKTSTFPLDVTFDMRLYLKDNKYKVVVDNIQTNAIIGIFTKMNAKSLEVAKQQGPLGMTGAEVMESEKAIANVVASLQTALAAKPESDF